ncbi:ATP-grasp fold amidoligase family protein [Pareuzebyella sediminis]|uniref:ATP-grasp fold amidoligase family protein n=1 Tax=Pareuzebyella sediminis TaxID=2607998 RepID=UPI0011EC4006|nr:ATP-grasp fold amidoligase family protein [Pareuzebyella sediminis]
MFRKFLKNIYESYPIGYYLLYPILKIVNFFKYELVNDKKTLENRFKRNFGRPIDLNNPKTLNEKIVWLKLYDRTPLHTQCSDKLAVREYVKAKIEEEYLVPLFFHTTDYKEITAHNLPDEPCIVKTNHDSGGGFFVRDKSKVNYSKLRQSLRIRMKRNYYQRSKEWQYKNIKPAIIVEKLLQKKDGTIPEDYKVHCFNGSVRMISVDIGRGTDNHKRNWYDVDWKRQPFKWSSPKANGKYTDPTDYEIPPPKTLTKMIELSELLAEPFAYVRIDWYDLEGKLYFGEITFHHDGGSQAIVPASWDDKLGAEIKLPAIGHE